eukprot:317770-Karenia_brevis.AAC.1
MGPTAHSNQWAKVLPAYKSVVNDICSAKVAANLWIRTYNLMAHTKFGYKAQLVDLPPEANA